MQKKLLIAVSVVALLVASMAVGIYAYQIDFEYDTLNTGAGSAEIRGGLYTTSSGDYAYMADTESSKSIVDASQPGVHRIAARILHSPEAATTSVGHIAVTAYGDVGSSTHTAESDMGDVYIYLSE
ncbi:MAG TPA: hypothetical protein H9681_10750 [Firmicutes bacterium]|nr:hypothetical protein [Bacillota bacterium]